MISTHILDTSRGQPAARVNVRLEKQEKQSWTICDSGMTNSDGRFTFDFKISKGTYRIVFEISDYFKKESFFVDTQVAFKIVKTTRKYHVPLLVSPFGYSTYRGS